MVAIYILRLEQNKFYVGMTKRNIERIWEHIDGKGAAWTKKYPPCEGNEILYFEEGLDPSDENRKTIEMMKRFGIHNVRGGDYCRVPWGFSVLQRRGGELWWALAIFLRF